MQRERRGDGKVAAGELGEEMKAEMEEMKGVEEAEMVSGDGVDKCGELTIR